MIDTFNIAEFESSLPLNKHTGEPLWHHYHKHTNRTGECTYLIDVIPQYASICIQSSIKLNVGISASTGKDSIRAYVIDPTTGKPLLGKLQKHICRTINWRVNLTNILRQLYRESLQLGQCPNCLSSATGIFTSHKPTSAGRKFKKCIGTCGFLYWMDQQ